MTYANLANSILDNTGRDSRDTRSNHRRDDRGQSQYEEDRDGVDALIRLRIISPLLNSTLTDPRLKRRLNPKRSTPKLCTILMNICQVIILIQVLLLILVGWWCLCFWMILFVDLKRVG